MSLRHRPLGASAAVLAAAWWVSAPAHATFSILAVDVKDGTVGGAVASCVDLATVELVYGAVPGRGAVMTQSILFEPAHDDALGWLAHGYSPDAILEALTSARYDDEFTLRQYAVVSTDGEITSFTGTGANGFASDVRFSVSDPADDPEPRYVVSVQGNFLTGDEVLSQARSGFEDPAGCDLPDRLWRALAAAGSRGAGDARCTVAGTPAQAARMSVDPPSAAPGAYLDLSSEVPELSSEDPLPALGDAFATWRDSHPCPEPLEPEDATPPAQTPSSDAEENNAGCTVASSNGRAAWAWLVMAPWAACGLRRRVRAAAKPRRVVVVVRGVRHRRV